MRRANEAEGKLRREPNILLHADGLEILQRVLRLIERVKRQCRIVFRLLHLVVEARIFFLQVTGVGKNDAAQIDCWCRCVDRAAKAVFDQPRNPAAMIEMGVGQNDRIDSVGRDRHVMPVALAPFLRPLKHAAVDENLQAVLTRRIACIDQMFRAGDRSGGAKKLDVRQISLPQPETREMD